MFGIVSKLTGNEADIKSLEQTVVMKCNRIAELETTIVLLHDQLSYIDKIITKGLVEKHGGVNGTLLLDATRRALEEADAALSGGE